MTASRRPGAATVPAALAMAAALCAPPSGAHAQVEAEPVLQGVVRLGDAAGSTPSGVTSETVVLHRVGADTAGAIDSIAVAADGSFSFRLPTVPDPGGRGELYFASVEHHGIMYFGGAVSTALQLDSLYVIEVHDTTAAPPGGARIPVAVRYLVLEPAAAPPGAPADEAGGWRMTDLFQVRNPGDRTLVGVDGGPVWSHPLPDAARRVQIGGGDVGPDASAVEDGRFVVRAPIPPGQRQFIVRYALESPELTIPLVGTTESLELLVREPAPPLRVEGLEADRPVEMETGSTYRRYTGTGLTDHTVTIEEGEEDTGPRISPRWLAVILALVLGAVGLWAALRPGPRASGRSSSSAAAGEGGDDPRPRTPEVRREALLLEVARIDEILEAGDPDPAEAERLRLRRAELVARLGGSG